MAVAAGPGEVAFVVFVEDWRFRGIGHKLKVKHFFF